MRKTIGFQLGAAVFGVAAVVIGLIVAQMARDEAAAYLENEVHAARNLVLMAESVRKNMERKWELGLFNTEMLRDITADSAAERKAKLLAAVPVVAAWESAKAKSAEGGFTFRTPRHNPRNPANVPDAVEAEALAYFEQNPQAQEHYVIDESQNAVRYFRPVRLGPVCMNCHGDPATSEAIWGTADGTDITGFKMDGRKVGDLHGAFEVIRSLAAADAATASAALHGIAIGVVGLISLLAALWFFIQRIVTRPVQAAVATLSAAEQDNDLSARLPEQGAAELVSIARSFNSFLGRLGHLTGDVKQATEQLSSTAEQLSANSAQTSANVQRQSAETEQVATAMNEMTVTVQEVTQNIVAASQAAGQANEAVEQGQQVVNAFTSLIGDLASDIEQGTDVIRRLHDDSDAITGILDVIRGIAEQTNLLALNAAIEAARAGEQGRGFAVVADEVRTLAQRTQESTQEIHAIIERVQAGAKNAVTAMEQGHDRVSNGVEQTEAVRAALAEIGTAVSRINEMSTQIAAAAEEQSVVAEEVNGNLHNISNVGTETAHGSRETQDASRMLAQLSVDLKNRVDQFKV
jgi:methyl-accepting chemotaxis protein